MGGGVKRTPLPWLGGLLVLYLAVPLGAFALRFIGSPTSGFSTPGLFSAFYISVVSATISLAIITTLGVPLAYALARSRSRFATIVGVVVQLPLALPPLMSGILLIYILGPYTTLGRLFDGRLTQSLAGVVFAQTFVSAPFLIVTARTAFGTVDPALMDVAATLGHSEFSRFMRVALPVASPGIRVGMLLAWLRAFGEYGAVVIVAYHPFTIPVYTYNEFSSTGLPDTIAPTVLSIVVAVVAVGISRTRIRRRGGHAALPAPTTPPPSASTTVSFDLDRRLGDFHLALAYEAAGSRLAILGPSGSGKSTLLRCLAGLLGEESGPIRFGDHSVQQIPVEQRRVGYVAQGFALFPHLTVRQQVMFAVDANPGVASYWLTRMHLDGLEDRLPSQLSGGQRQRVALAQALSRSPDLLLLDEPFSALDAPVRHELRRVLRHLQRESGLSTVLVTHDPEEAAILADEVIVVSNGTSLQSGSTRQVFSRPSSPEVARLLGIPNLHEAAVTAPGLIDVGGALLEVDSADLALGTAVLWSIRPEHIRLSPTEGLSASLADITDLGTTTELIVWVNPTLELELRTPNHIDLVIGDICHIELPRDAITLWPRPDHAPGNPA